jgi:alanyl-tRNA synthetase
MLSSEIRRKYLDFFENQKHQITPSSSLIPAEDPTLLLTTAGMVQFKPYFTGEISTPVTRFTSSQKCFRVTDLEEVGDETHLTFFEMLGNFSIGDYFKKEAIIWSLEFVTNILGLDKEKLWATIYTDDDEALNLWIAAGIPENRIRRFGDSDNFWGPAGSEGPCGPCSELHYDFGGPCTANNNDLCGPNCCSRFLELWNLVFMQYFQDLNGNRTPLPNPNIDTGMGLERAAMILQKVNSLYETDLFLPIIEKVENIFKTKYGIDTEIDYSIRVIAEHVRSATFLIADGVVPSNEGRGYVLRRLIRRAIRFSKKIYSVSESHNLCLNQVSKTVVETMGQHYPDLIAGEKFIYKALDQEELQFSKILDRGYDYLMQLIEKGINDGIIPGEEIFKLHDTYGFPIEVTKEVAQENSITLDIENFELLMEGQKTKARLSADFSGDSESTKIYASINLESEFIGYDKIEGNSVITAIFSNGKQIDKLESKETGEIILTSTPFYAESGGQLGDKGYIQTKTGTFVVEDTQSPISGIISHKGYVANGTIFTTDDTSTNVDNIYRQGTSRNHTATHILHSSLREILGTHVRQAGSRVANDHLRFDFTHIGSMSMEELKAVENLANTQVRSNHFISTEITTYRDAVSNGALAFFGDRYGSEVRMVTIATTEPFSVEVCGGTHLENTGQIGYIKIINETNIGSGMRRIEAVSGETASEYSINDQFTLTRIAQLLETNLPTIESRIDFLLQENKDLKSSINSYEQTQFLTQSKQLSSKIKTIENIEIITSMVNVSAPQDIKNISDLLKDTIKSGIINLGAVIDNKPYILLVVTDDLVEKGAVAVAAIKESSKYLQGGGGGKPNIATGGGKDITKINDALNLNEEIIFKQLRG